jgi:hypothetical protein
VLDAVHVCPDPLEQHICDNPPHPPQLPPAHVPPTLGQVAPDATHWFCTQQPSAPQLFPTQHGWPGPPHATHTLLLHASALPHCRPLQQACPAPPHDWQMLFTQAPPG